MFYSIKKLLDTKWKEFKKKHKLRTYEIEKMLLSCFDDKRCNKVVIIKKIVIIEKDHDYYWKRLS